MIYIFNEYEVDYMMTLEEKINNERKQAAEKSIANRILEKMDKLRLEKNSASSKRWVWELIQNAKDLVESDEKVKIEIDFDINKKTLSFKHNGFPFTPKTLTFLIEQVSTKERVNAGEKSKTTGKFGTGFLTTHLLSEIVDLSGIIFDDDSYKEFNLTLDRSGRDINSILTAINKSIQQLNSSNTTLPITNFSKDRFSANFSFVLDERGINVAQSGLEDLQHNLLYVLIFLNNIESIEIKHLNTKYYLDSEVLEIHDNLNVYTVCKEKDGETKKNFFIISKNENVSIAMPIVFEGNKIRFIKNNSAKIFCDFPLVGTEKFPLPFVINSCLFNPTEPRDGIYITDVDDEKVICNKKILEEGISLFFDLVDYSASNHWDDMYLFADFAHKISADWVESDWVDKNITSIIFNKLLHTPIVKMNSNEFKSIRSDLDKANVWFPYGLTAKIREMIWQLYDKIIPGILPIKEDIEKWFIVLWKGCPELTVAELAGDLQNIKSIAELEKDIYDKQHFNEINFLNLFYDLLQESKSEDFITNNKYSILPNQHGQFCFMSQLKKPENIEESIKNIYLILGKDCRSYLLNDSIIIPFELQLENINQNDIVNDINRIISKGNDQPLILKACQNLLQLFPNNADVAKKRQKIHEFYQNIINRNFDKYTIDNWTEDIWIESDKVIVKYIAQEISKRNDIEHLEESLNFSYERTIKWLIDYISYVQDNNFSIIDSTTIPFIPNQNGKFLTKDEISLDNEIDDEIKNFCCSLGDDIKEELLLNEMYLKLPEKRWIDTNAVAIRLIEAVDVHLKRGVDEITQHIFNKIVLWLEDNQDLAKKYLSKLIDKKHKLYSEQQVVENIRKAEKVDIFLRKYNLESLDEIEDLLINARDSNKSKTIEDEKIKSLNLQEILIAYGISNEEQLEKALQEKSFANIFNHKPIPTIEMFHYAQEKIERAKVKILEYLKTLQGYDCEHAEYVSQTVLAGIRKGNDEVHIVVRPSDYGVVLFYYSAEKDALDYANAELWVEDGKSTPQLLTLGAIIKKARIQRIPLNRG